MKISCEASQSEIGTDNLLLDDTNNHNLGVRLIFMGEQNRTRSEFVLTYSEAIALRKSIIDSLEQIDKCYDIFEEMKKKNKKSS